MKPIVQFDNVTKVYQLGNSSTSLRASLSNVANLILRKERQDPAELVALNHVSFDIEKGESVGFIGPNGSGKTTTLKLISSITRANSGSVYINGKISALIELGSGFHPDLTGRENIYFNAAILGMRKQEIQKRFDAIVDFSGVERFLDTPVKRYSSGMYCRLGFAVAAYVNPDILLVDEVLAVGDQAFQNKCLKRMNDLRTEGTTIIFVTHNLGYLQRLCQRVIFIYKGNIVEDGPVSKVIQTYRDHASYNMGTFGSSAENTSTDPVSCPVELPVKTSSSPVQIKDVYFCNEASERIDRLQTGSAFEINIDYEVIQPVTEANFEVWIYGLDGAEYATFSTEWDGDSDIHLERSGKATLCIDQLCLMPGLYFINVAISDKIGLTKYDLHWEQHRLIVLSGPISHGLIFQPHKWDLLETR